MQAVDGFREPLDDEYELSVHTAVSSLSDTEAAMRDIAQKLQAQHRSLPDFITLHHGAGRSGGALWPHANEYFGKCKAFHGASSCMGVMSEKGAELQSGGAIGAFAIWDPAGAYGTAMMELGKSPNLAAAAATRAALVRAGRAGEAPHLVWVTATPGQEEAVLDGIKDVIGTSAMIVGGSAADNLLAGGWSVFASDGVSDDAVVVSVLFPSSPFGSAFESGYAPTDRRGVVTSANGRYLLGIDGRPAAEVYAEWTDGRIEVPLSGSASILSEATFAPLGRKHTEIQDIPIHILAHPANIHADGGLELFSNVEVGVEICLMEGSAASLVQRAGRIARDSCAQLGAVPIAGALMVYCGGCMLAIRDRMDEVAERVDENLGGAPFIGIFSFGEQGEMLDGVSAHGNLMISCLTFGRRSGPRRL